MPVVAETLDEQVRPVYRALLDLAEIISYISQTIRARQTAFSNA